MRHQKGSALSEYLVLMSGICVVCLFAVWYFGQILTRTFEGFVPIVSLIERVVGAPSPGNNLPIEEAPSPNTPPAGEEEKDIIYLPTVIIAWDSGQTRANSVYFSPPEASKGPTSFVLRASQGSNAVLDANVVSGNPSYTGTFYPGTLFVANVPGYGETVEVSMETDKSIYYWNLQRAPLPVVKDFSFGETVLSWNETRERVNSPYLDLEGLEFIPRPFEVSGEGMPLAVSNVVGGMHARTGQVADGTMFEVDTPPPGTTRIISIQVGEGRGEWRIRRNPIPDRNAFRLTSNNGMSFAQIHFSQMGAPNIPYKFSISGTGNTNPYVDGISSGSSRDGWTQNWGVNMHYTTPPRGVSETITLIIDGETLSWTATGP